MPSCRDSSSSEMLAAMAAASRISSAVQCRSNRPKQALDTNSKPPFRTHTRRAVVSGSDGEPPPEIRMLPCGTPAATSSGWRLWAVG